MDHTEPFSHNEGHERKGIPIIPIVVTIICMIGWLVFILLYALFWSKSYDLFQNIIVTLVTLAIAGLFVALVWILWIRSFGRYGWRMY